MPKDREGRVTLSPTYRVKKKEPEKVKEPTADFEQTEEIEEAVTKEHPLKGKQLTLAAFGNVEDDTADDFEDADTDFEDAESPLETEAVEDVNEGLDPESLNMLSVLLKRDPRLSDKIAEVIMEHYKGEQGMYDDFDNVGGNDFGGAGAPGVGQAGLGTDTQGTPNMSPEMLQRLERLEQGYAHTALERELAETTKEYETLRSQFPILPDLNEQEILQIALDKGALPLSDALTLWAMQQMRGGEGSPADRIVAAAMASGKGKNLPSPEGKGGVAPAAEGAQPENLREARSMAKDRIRALFGSGPG